jgi:hypothetical protein
MRRLRAPIGRYSADRADIAVFRDHLADPEAVIERLLTFDVICVMRERSPLPRNIIERLPNLEHTILSGGYPRAKAPLVLGSEGAGVVEDANGSDFSLGARVMFAGPYGVSEDGAYSEYLPGVVDP